MEQLPLSRDSGGQVHLNGTGPVKICMDYQEILGSGGQGTVFRAKIFDDGDAHILMEVRMTITQKVCSRRSLLLPPLVGRLCPVTST